MMKNDIMELKEKVEQAKAALSRLEGQKEQLMNTLKEEFGVSSSEELEAMIKECEEEMGSLERKITTKLRVVKKKYGVSDE